MCAGMASCICWVSLAGWALGRYRARQPGSGWTAEQVDDLVFYIALGCHSRRPDRLHPVLWLQFLPRQSAGAVPGLGGRHVVSRRVYRRAAGHGAVRPQVPKSILATIDFVAPLIAPGILFGRLGNFINGELWGRVTDLPWGMIFRQTGDNLPRHPSQLYEATLEGLALFLIVWLFSAKPAPTMAVSGVFALSYGGIFRFLVEFVRQPDAARLSSFRLVTMGQVLSLPLIMVGVVLLTLAYGRRPAGRA